MYIIRFVYISHWSTLAKYQEKTRKFGDMLRRKGYSNHMTTTFGITETR